VHGAWRRAQGQGTQKAVDLESGMQTVIFLCISVYSAVNNLGGSEIDPGS
jgi:hypothetical protein